MTIGQWVRRREPGRKWHLVESVITDEPVTHCGRRLRRHEDEGYDVSNVMPLTRMIGQPQLCKQCE